MFTVNDNVVSFSLSRDVLTPRQIENLDYTLLTAMGKYEKENKKASVKQLAKTQLLQMFEKYPETKCPQLCKNGAVPKWLLKIVSEYPLVGVYSEKLVVSFKGCYYAKHDRFNPLYDGMSIYSFSDKDCFFYNLGEVVDIEQVLENLEKKFIFEHLSNSFLDTLK